MSDATHVPAADERVADRRLARGIARVLRVGVLLSAVVTLAGGVLLLLARGGAPADLAAAPRTPPPSDLLAIVRGALALDARALTQLGVVLLVATPVARVALAAAHYARRRDGAYVALTGLVLLLLVAGIAVG